MDSRVLLDAAARRFKAHQIFLKTQAARRWVEQRRRIIGNGQPGPQHQPRLQAVDATLRTVCLRLIPMKSLMWSNHSSNHR
jgi:hypothetical protein